MENKKWHEENVAEIMTFARDFVRKFNFDFARKYFATFYGCKIFYV